MIYQDKGYLLSKSKYNENSAIAEFFTINNGKVTGQIFGATSRKIKNYLLVGNKFHINFNSKNENKIGYLKIEIEKIETPLFLNHEKKLLCIIYSMNLIKILTVEGQENKNIFNLIEHLFQILKRDEWLFDYIFWELKIYKNLGYEINFNDYVKKITDGNDVKFIVEITNKEIPTFLINKENNNINLKEFLNGFKIVGEFLEKTILKPNNISFPNSRNDFLNSLKFR